MRNRCENRSGLWWNGVKLREKRGEISGKNHVFEVKIFLFIIYRGCTDGKDALFGGRAVRK